MYKFTVYMLWILDDGWDVTDDTWRHHIREEVLDRGILSQDERTALLEAAFQVDTLAETLPQDGTSITLLEAFGEPYIRLERNAVHADS